MKTKPLVWGMALLLPSCVSTQSKVANPPAAVHASATSEAPPAAEPPAEADTCNHPDAPIGCCFAQVPATVSDTMQIAPSGENGAKLRISGTLYHSNGRKPYPGVLMYAWHTDHNGYYSKKGDETGIARVHGYLHGWCITDSNGHYEIISIRPGKYPNNSSPAHIHAALQTPEGASFYINDFVFSDDKLVDAAYLKGLTLSGGDGVIKLKRDTDGAWTGKRDIIVPAKPR
jgi:protocatechuate 3,4-dioxygenase beta subunit